MVFIKNSGLKRFYKAFIYSCQGLRYAFLKEAAFRQESLAATILIPLAVVLPVAAWQSLAMVLAVLFVLLVELLNSAIEAVVDRIGTEHHELAGRAKDMGSAAVLIALVMCCVTWAVILFQRFAHVFSLR